MGYLELESLYEPGTGGSRGINLKQILATTVEEEGVKMRKLDE